MPTYCYRTTTDDADGTVERDFAMGKAPKFIRVNGRKAYRSLQAEAPCVVGTKALHCRAHEALGVHPKQIREMQELLRRKGVRATQYDPKTGDCLVENRTHVNEICRARGMRNQDGGYGDWCGR